MTRTMENAPSVEKIFAAVTTEIKPNIKGKYFVQIDDNWRMQSVRESFVTLEDAVKIARIMHSELRKVSRHIEVKVESRTIDINKYCFRTDEWTTLFEIDNYGNEKIKHRDTVKAVAKIENRTVEEVTGNIGRSTDDYGVYHNTAKVEEVNAKAEKKPLQEKIAVLRTTEKIISEKYLNVCRDLYIKDDGEYHSAIGFDDYVTKYHDTFYCREGNNYVEDATAYSELKEIEREWNAIFEKLEYLEKIEEKADILKAKIADQKKNRKPIIDWKATFEDMQISEILDLQKDLKKFLKVGQIDLAENVFSMLKTLCRNYRAAA